MPVLPSRDGEGADAKPIPDRLPFMRSVMAQLCGA